MKRIVTFLLIVGMNIAIVGCAECFGGGPGCGACDGGGDDYVNSPRGAQELETFDQNVKTLLLHDDLYETRRVLKATE